MWPSPCVTWTAAPCLHRYSVQRPNKSWCRLWGQWPPCHCNHWQHWEVLEKGWSRPIHCLHFSESIPEDVSLQLQQVVCRHGARNFMLTVHTCISCLWATGWVHAWNNELLGQFGHLQRCVVAPQGSKGCFERFGVYLNDIEYFWGD